MDWNLLFQANCIPSKESTTNKGYYKSEYHLMKMIKKQNVLPSLIKDYLSWYGSNIKVSKAAYVLCYCDGRAVVFFSSATHKVLCVVCSPIGSPQRYEKM